jgi:hypothetical protein
MLSTSECLMAKGNKMITQEQVREIFNYCETTGELSRRYATRGYDAGRKITRKNDQGYLVTTIGTKTYRVHHLVWTYFNGELPSQLDHVNRIRDDNRIDNLRPCAIFQNSGNCVARVHKYKGVTFDKRNQKWRAQIGIQYRNVPLGRFSTIEEAAIAYNNAAREYFGEFAVLNEVSLENS